MRARGRPEVGGRGLSDYCSYTYRTEEWTTWNWYCVFSEEEESEMGEMVRGGGKWACGGRIGMFVFLHRLVLVFILRLRLRLRL